MLKSTRKRYSLADFFRNTEALLKRMKETGRPLVLKINAREKIVVQDADAYERLLELIDHIEALEGIAKGLKSVEAGNTRSIEEFDKAFRRKHGIPDSHLRLRTGGK